MSMPAACSDYTSRQVGDSGRVRWWAHRLLDIPLPEAASAAWRPVMTQVQTRMPRTSELSFNRQALTSSQIAVCVYCLKEFHPSRITEWVDEGSGGETALCPFCDIDAVAGFNGEVDSAWVAEEHRKQLEGK